MKSIVVFLKAWGVILQKWGFSISSSAWLVTLLVLLLVVSIFGEVCTFHFLPYWDDDTNIHRNPLYSPLSWGSIIRFWEGPFQQLYIPVTYSLWGALVALSRIVAGTSIAVGPINAAIFHGANLCVHLLATGMVFLLLRQLLPSLVDPKVSSQRLVIAAGVGALAFALHPVQVESVSWVSGLRDLLGGAFSLAALALFFAFLKESAQLRRWFLYGLATLLILLAFGSKPGSVVTPALALLLGIYFLKSHKGLFTKLLWLLPWFLMAITEVVMTSKAQPAAELAASLVPIWARPLVACDAIVFYLGKLVWPFNLCADYGRSPNSMFDGGFLAWSWILPLIVILTLALVKKLRLYLLPLAVLVIGVLPTLGFIPFNFQVVSTVADHYLYLGMLGLALAIALIICHVSAQIATVLALLLLPFWSILTLQLLPEWADGRVFFPATIINNPGSWKSHHNYACTLDAGGKYPEALEQFAEAIRLRPSNAEAHNDMALTLMKLGRTQDAIVSFQNSLQIRPTAGAARNLAYLLLTTGNPTQAIQTYRFAMQVDPSDLQNQRALAWVLATYPDDGVRNGKEAVALASQIVTATNGQVPIFLLTLSAALAETGEFDKATAVATQAAQVFRNTGDPRMTQVIEQQVLPVFHGHNPIRDNPVKGS